MKKVYEKPQFVFESFEMSTNIAAGCAHTNVVPSEGVAGCGYVVGRQEDMVVFTSGIGCPTQKDDGEYDGICYHTPVDGNSIFTS